MLERGIRGHGAAPAAATFVLAFGILVPPAHAQVDAGTRPRVTISSSFGYMVGGPARGIEAMLEAGGFGDFLEGGCQIEACYADRDYPLTASDPGPGSNVRISYSQWERLEVALSRGTSRPAETEGFSEVAVPEFGRFSVMDSDLGMLAATASLRVGAASVGGGPARYRLRTWAGDDDQRLDGSTATKIGALLEAGAQFPMFKKVILDLRVQYRYVGETEVGPLQIQSRTLPATTVDFSHTFIGIGLGLAF